MIMQFNQNEFVGSLTNLCVNIFVNDTVAEGQDRLVASCMHEAVSFGDKAALISVDTLPVSDYADASSLLSVVKPIMDEQQLDTTDRKKIQVTLNKYLMAGAFTGEYSLAEAFAVILSMLTKTKEIYLYKKVVAAYEGYVGGKENDGTLKPMLATQTITIDLINVDNLTSEVEKQAARTANSNKCLRVMLKTYHNLCAPSRKYNELGYETKSKPRDLKFVVNDNFETNFVTDSFATLLNSGRISERETWSETIVIPEDQFANEQTKTSVIGWFGHKDKYQIKPRFEVGTSFFDASNLNQNDWLHFWLISGFANGLPMVKFVANYVE